MLWPDATSRGPGPWLWAMRRVAQRRPVILGYHGIDESALRADLSRLQVSPAAFEAQLELLLEAGFRFVTVAEIAARLGSGGPPPGLAAVTFDDGMANNHSIALPILSRLGIPATVYIAVDFIGGQSPWVAGAGGQMLSEQQIVELAGAGWEIGAHTMSHADLEKLGYDECRREMEDSRAALERISATSVQTFAYPFGRYGPAAVAAAADAGFLAAVTTGSGKWAPHELTRAMVSAGDPLAVLFLKYTDRYEPLLSSAPLRVLRRLSKRWRDRLRGQ
jgi:peptidoglycan/xylan/chitin deacetylase (PgdA/CDA1 family)